MKTIYYRSVFLVLSQTRSQSFSIPDTSSHQLTTFGTQGNTAKFPRYHLSDAKNRNALGRLEQKVPIASKNISPRQWFLFRERKQICAAIFPVLTVLLFAGSAHSASANIRAERLGWRNLWSTAMVLISIGALPLSYFGVTSLAKSLLVSAGRCALQVSLLGSLILQRMMGVTRPGIVGAWILGVGLIASNEATSRIQYSYPDMKRNMYVSVLASGLGVLSLTASLKLFGYVSPWFDPRTWIPIAGMLFGNTLNASALSASSITKKFASESDAVELRLTRGASTREAIAPIVEESYRIALMPTINSLAATGIIHIPGMMSGQILAGQSPQQAALYQIVITFLISTTAILSVQLVINSTVGSIVDTRESRLRHGILKPKQNATTKHALKSIFSFVKSREEKISPSSSASIREDGQYPTLVRKLVLPMEGNTGTTTLFREEKDEAPVLEIKDLEVRRANAVIDLVLRRGDRIAITGRSGIGKSQILRTIIGLEELKGGNRRVLSLFGNAVGPSDLPWFRRRVCLVLPNKPTLEGTPNQFFHQILQWRSQDERESEQTTPVPTIAPKDIAKQWDLGAEAFDREWRTLSGGESQRVALAMALSLEPNVLLLDESTSFLDERTSMLVEETLRSSHIPIVIVTHSEDQLNRFCTHQLDL